VLEKAGSLAPPRGVQEMRLRPPTSSRQGNRGTRSLLISCFNVLSRHWRCPTPSTRQRLAALFNQGLRSGHYALAAENPQRRRDEAVLSGGRKLKVTGGLPQVFEARHSSRAIPSRWSWRPTRWPRATVDA